MRLLRKGWFAFLESVGFGTPRRTRKLHEQQHMANVLDVISTHNRDQADNYIEYLEHLRRVLTKEQKLISRNYD